MTALTITLLTVAAGVLWILGAIVAGFVRGFTRACVEAGLTRREAARRLWRS